MSPCFLTLYAVKVGVNYQVRGRRVFEEHTDSVVMTHKQFKSRQEARMWATRYVKHNKKNFVSIIIKSSSHYQCPVPVFPGCTVRWLDDSPALHTHKLSHIKVYL